MAIVTDINYVYILLKGNNIVLNYYWLIVLVGWSVIVLLPIIYAWWWESSIFLCKHYSEDNMIYLTNPPKLKCSKCGEFYNEQ